MRENHPNNVMPRSAARGSKRSQRPRVRRWPRPGRGGRGDEWWDGGALRRPRDGDFSLGPTIL